MVLRPQFSVPMGLLMLLRKALPTASGLSTNNAGMVVSHPTLRKMQETTADIMEENNEFLGIPGTTQTFDGYDTALGNEAICWVGAGAEDANATGEAATGDAALQLRKIAFPNPLVENYTLVGETAILKQCPGGNSVEVHKPQESTRGERLRTLRFYNYSLHVEIDLDSLDGDEIITDNKTATIALQVVLCSLGKSGFCSPFVHEQANLRETIQKQQSGQTIEATKKKVKGDLHGGTHIHSPWKFLPLGGNRTLNDTVILPMIVNHPGEYFVIGTVQLYTHSINATNGTTNIYRWDIANALKSEESRYLLYQDPPELMQVSASVLSFSYAAIAIAGVVIVFLVYQTLRNRSHQVLQLSQGDFLLVFLFCALMSTTCAFLFQPKNDVYCRISYPIILIPIQLMYAITVGRMWRIHAVISPLLLEHINKGRTGFTQRFVQGITYISFKLHNRFVWNKENMRKSTAGAKQQISQFQLALVVALFTLPQVVLQLVALIVQPMELMIDYNEDESVGRYKCGADVPGAHNLITYSFLLLFLLVIVLLVMAHSSRKLPSLFNETNVIYDSTFLSLVLLLLGGAVITLTDNPDTSPDVQYLVSLVLMLSLTLNPAVRIMLPKLNMVWKNETVVVSKLVTDHHRRAREKESDRARAGLTGSVIVSGLDDSNTRRYHENFPKNGDFDTMQTNRLLTIHSCSQDTVGFGAASSEDPSSFADLSSSMANEKIESVANAPMDGQLAVIKEAPTNQNSSASQEPRNYVHHSADLTSSTDVDGHSGGSGSSPTLNAELKDEGGSINVEANNACAPDDELDIEAAEDSFSSKKGPLLDQSPTGFLKNAMTKGRSWKLPELGPKGVTFDGDREKNEGLDKSQRGEKSEFPRRNHETSPNRPKKRLQKTIVVTEDETPARRLVLKMLDLQDQLEAVNNKIMSGLAVTQEDWSVITKLTSKLDRTFSDEVEFEWDIARHYEETLQEVLPQDMSGRSWASAGGNSTRNFTHKRGSGCSDVSDNLRGSGRSETSSKKSGPKKDSERSLNLSLGSLASFKSVRMLLGKGKKKDDCGESDQSLRSLPGAEGVQVCVDGKRGVLLPSPSPPPNPREKPDTFSSPPAPDASKPDLSSAPLSPPPEVPSRLDSDTSNPPKSSTATSRPKMSTVDCGTSGDTNVTNFRDEDEAGGMFFL